MHSQKNDQEGNKQGSGFAGFVSKRLVVSVVVIIGVIWILSVVLDRLNLNQRDYGIQPKTGQDNTQGHSQSHVQAQKTHGHSAEEQQPIESSTTAAPAERSIERSPGHAPHPTEPRGPAQGGHMSTETDSTAGMHASKAQHDAPQQDASASGKAASSPTHAPAHEAGEHGPGAKTTKRDLHDDAVESKHPPTTTDKKQTDARPGHEAADQDKHAEKPDKTAKPHAPAEEPAHAPQPKGVAFVEAVMQPMDYELNHRFWGWRPNDIINITDNVNNSQLGILEVTRRTVVQLTQRISRTGSTDAFNPHLENAMNWLMVKADRYWFPAPETKYKESLEELEAYKEMLINRKASFYIRTDNLIPLLTAYEDLLGSCDENLVKAAEDDGSAVSFFKADDYFYYARGVASAMAVILEAVHHDFSPTLDSRNGSELLHHAIVSCQTASKLSPLIIMNSDLDGFFANHRANMAAPISHARFYISQLIKTLST
jgi:hypothetical protein